MYSESSRGFGSKEIVELFSDFLGQVPIDFFGLCTSELDVFGKGVDVPSSFEGSIEEDMSGVSGHAFLVFGDISDGSVTLLNGGLFSDVFDIFLESFSDSESSDIFMDDMFGLVSVACDILARFSVWALVAVWTGLSSKFVDIRESDGAEFDELGPFFELVFVLVDPHFPSK